MDFVDLIKIDKKHNLSKMTNFIQLASIFGLFKAKIYKYLDHTKITFSYQYLFQAEHLQRH